MFGFFLSDKMSHSGSSERKCVGLVVSVSQALGVAINHPVVVAVAVQLLRWPTAHVQCPLCHSPPAGRIAASPLSFSGPPQLIAAPLSFVNNVSLAHVVMIFHGASSVKKAPWFIIHKGNIFFQLPHFLYDFYLWLANSDD